jgi:hypothetical protein
MPVSKNPNTKNDISREAGTDASAYFICSVLKVRASMSGSSRRGTIKIHLQNSFFGEFNCFQQMEYGKKPSATWPITLAQSALVHRG